MEPNPNHFQHEAACNTPDGGTNDDECICSRSHIRKENKRLGRLTPLPKHPFRQVITDVSSSENPYAKVYGIRDNADTMDVLREMFPTGEADPENFVVFSTSGAHGTFETIEDIEKEVVNNGFTFNGVTCVIIHPRLVCMKYARAYPETPEDFEFLKKLRASSFTAVSKIGMS